MIKLKVQLLVLLMFFGISSSFAAENCPPLFNSSDDPILLGELKISEIEQFKWYKENYAAYQPNAKIVKSIQNKIKDRTLQIEIYFGTWCPDSQYEVPNLIKLLEMIDFDMTQVKLVGLGRDKVVPDVDEKTASQLDIKMIPTFIFYEDGKEINRFVEFAQTTLEEDVLSIVSNENYQHSYK